MLPPVTLEQDLHRNAELMLQTLAFALTSLVSCAETIDYYGAQTMHVLVRKRTAF